MCEPRVKTNTFFSVKQMPPPYLSTNTEEEKKIFESEEVISIDGSYILDMACMLDTAINELDYDSTVQYKYSLDRSNNREDTHSKKKLEKTGESFENTEGDIEYSGDIECVESFIAKTEFDLENSEGSLFESLARSEICHINAVESSLTAKEVTDHLYKTAAYEIETYASQIKNESDGESDIAEFYTSAEMEMYHDKFPETGFKAEREEIAGVKVEEDPIEDKVNPLISVVKRQCSDCGYQSWTNSQFRKHKCTHHLAPNEKTASAEESNCQQIVGNSNIISPQSRLQSSRAIQRIYSLKNSNKCGKSPKGIKLMQSNKITKSNKSKLAKASVTKSKKNSPVKTSSKQASSPEVSRFRCSQCDFTTKGAKTLMRHEASHKVPTLYNCAWCQFSCVSIDELNVHSTKHEQFKSYTCSDCPYTVRYLWMLQPHRLTHHSGDIVCKYCNSKFSSASVLTEHLQKQTCSSFTCKYCCFTSPSAEGLRRHLRARHSSATDQEQKRYKCKLCPFSSRHASGLYGHVFNHTGLRPYRCSICDYRCPQKFMLKRHMLVHTQERPFKCNMCNFASNTKYNLKLHTMMHMQEKPHVCQTCGFSSIRRNTLKFHMKTHTKEKNYKCNMCNFTCSHYSSMRRHRPTHTRSKLHCCPDCPYWCKLLSSYLRHRATVHGALGGYTCVLCPFVCDRARQLARHRLDRHGQGGPCVTGYPDKRKNGKRSAPIKNGASVMTVTNGHGTSKKMCTVKTEAPMKKTKTGTPVKSMKKTRDKIVTGGSTKTVKKTREKYSIPMKTDASMEKRIERTVSTFDTSSLLDIKVVCRRLAISEILLGRLNSEM